MGVLGNHLLNCAGVHASDRGFGIATLNEDNYTWVQMCIRDSSGMGKLNFRLLSAFVRKTGRSVRLYNSCKFNC